MGDQRVAAIAFEDYLGRVPSESGRCAPFLLLCLFYVICLRANKE